LSFVRRGHLRGSKCGTTIFGRGFAPCLTGGVEGAYSAPRPLAGEEEVCFPAQLSVFQALLSPPMFPGTPVSFF